MDNDGRDLRRWQRRFWLGAGLVAPVAPLLYLQGRVTRWKVGLLPDAGGERSGSTSGELPAATLFVIGESTVAGLGARDHEHALAGRFAHYLSQKIGRAVSWQVSGKNGVTARRTIDELLPEMPDTQFDYILLGIGGNDVMKLSTPRKWRTDMLELIAQVRTRQPAAHIFISNCPMIIASPALPEPIRSLLWQLSQMHDANIRQFASGFERLQYYPQPKKLDSPGFFADGIHPSERGYDEWAEAMIEYFFQDK